MSNALLTGGNLIGGGPLSTYNLNNIAIINATTSIANDSIKITGANGSPLSPNNPGFISSQATATTLKSVPILADVTIKITGAHWGFTGLGNLTNQVLHVFAVIDTDGTVKWLVGANPAPATVVSASCFTAQASVTTILKYITNITLVGNSNLIRVGWFRANFTDAGSGWAVQSTTADLQVGRQPIPYMIRDQYQLSGTPTLASGWTSNYYFTTSTHTANAGCCVYTSDHTNGDSISLINKVGHYSITGNVSSSVAGSSGLVIGIYTGQTISGNGTLIGAMSYTSSGGTSIQNHSCSRHIFMPDDVIVLTFKLVRLTGTVTSIAITIKIDFWPLFPYNGGTGCW